MTKYHIRKRWILNAIPIIISFLLVLGVNFCFQPILVKGNSMNSTYQNNDFLISSKIAYNDHKIPQKGDIVIIDGHEVGVSSLIKRVVANAGDTVEIKNGRLYVNDKKIEESYVKEKANQDMNKITVVDNSVFVMGDNRNNSVDSRNLGPVSLSDIQEKVVVDNNIIKQIGHIIGAVTNK